MTTNSIKYSTQLKVILSIVVGLLIAAVIVLSVFLGMYTTDRAKFRSNVENIYQQSFYTLVEDITRIEQSLYKLPNVSSPNLMRELMQETSRNATSATGAINTMNSGNEQLRKLLRFFNQVGDYNQYLLRKVDSNLNKADKKYIDAKDYETLAEMADICRNVGRKLNQMREHLRGGYKFTELLGKEGDFFGEIVAELNASGMAYPSLIYDGPFSDGVKDRPALGISGDNISESQALDMAAKYLPDSKIISSRIIGTSDNRIKSYNIAVMIEAEREVTMQISVQGGSLLMMDIDKTITDPTIDIAEAEERAEKYCKDIGFKNMTAVWATNNDSTVYINLCYTKNDTIYYADMVKVKIALDSGEIIGFEGLNYAFNHTERTIATPLIDKEEAELNISSNVSLITSRLALVPITLNTEVLCYEVLGKVGEDFYFIYVNAMTGDEIKILRVLDSSQGELLM